MNCSNEFIDPIRQKIIQIDIEPLNAGWTYPIDIGVTSDAKLALQEIIRILKQKKPNIDVKSRIKALVEKKKVPENEWFHHKMMDQDPQETPINPEVVVKIINEIIRDNDKLVLGAGNNRMWFTKLFQTKVPGQLIGPFGAAGMGWASSAAMTCSMIHKEGKTIAVEGDGSMLMCLYNFETMKQYGFDPIIVVINNGCFGNVRDYLSSKGRKFCDYERPSFAAIAEAMGLKGVSVFEADELRKELKDALTKDYPVIIDVEVKPASHMRIRTKKKIN
jgi:thiamine pyrophosphate-dependent acetolactate synthase large subunit-like protein